MERTMMIFLLPFLRRTASQIKLDHRDTSHLRSQTLIFVHRCYRSLKARPPLPLNPQQERKQVAPAYLYLHEISPAIHIISALVLLTRRTGNPWLWVEGLLPSTVRRLAYPPAD
ncbi:hypothetical protein EMPG_12414 [Blastomyces silverae]|uniref:Uncharacterized protein n=1 Tax=Blastomyces silverae TaxID=2060906 RepID=A0A0H1BM12_9EURO|nr:hypothetical protein EMPG_12414 [Blastomyces silverae]